MPELRGVNVGVLHHGHGFDVFVGWTEDEVMDKVYGYVKEWWDDFCPEQDLPEDRNKAILAYFEAAGEKEFFDMMGDTLEV